MFACVYVCLPVCLPDCLSICVSVCLSICVSVCLSLCLSVCLSVYLSICFCFLSVFALFQPKLVLCYVLRMFLHNFPQPHTPQKLTEYMYCNITIKSNYWVHETFERFNFQVNIIINQCVIEIKMWPWIMNDTAATFQTHQNIIIISTHQLSLSYHHQ